MRNLVLLLILPLLLQNADSQDRQRVERNEQLLKRIGRIESITWIDAEQSPEAAIALVDRLKILIPLHRVEFGSCH